MTNDRGKYLVISHPLNHGPLTTLFFVTVFGFTLAQALPVFYALIRGRCWGPNSDDEDLGSSRALLLFSALFLGFWVSRLSARTVYTAPE